MLSSHRFVAPSMLILLTAALMSCGGQVLPVQGSASAPAAGGQTAGTPVGDPQIVTLSIRPGTTEADVKSRYPGATLLVLNPDEGYAQVLVPSAAQSASQGVTSAATLNTLSLNAQAVMVTASEPNVILSASTNSTSATDNTNNTDAQGTSAWAGGTSAWAGGYSSGSAPMTSANTFTENLPAWNLLDVSGGQRLASALGRGVRVAIIDTGVDISHPGLAGHLDVASGWDYVGADAVPQEENSATTGYSSAYGHGTAVAGVILQIAPNVTVVPYRVLNPSGKGKLSDVIMAINAAVKSGAKVINMSLGTTTASAALSAAVSSAIRSGAMVVASSGNSGDNKVTYPARSSGEMQASLGGGLISVGSENLAQQKSSFSTYGSLDLLAPAEAVKTTFPGNKFTRATGTSFAAPMVSGEVALAMSNGRTDPIALYRAIKLNALLPLDLLYLGQLGNGTPNFYKLMVNR